MIKKILENNKNIDGFRILESRTEASELFLVKDRVDMDRAKKVRHFKVTVYVNAEEGGEKYTGASTINLHPTMSAAEMEKAIDEAALAAGFVRNPWYPLAKPSGTNGTNGTAGTTETYKTRDNDGASEGGRSDRISEMTKALYRCDADEKGGINSCEIFHNLEYIRIINSEGVDVSSESCADMIELVTTWKEGGEEIELYRCMEFSGFDPEAVSAEAGELLNICRERAAALATPVIERTAVLLTREAVREFFGFYLAKSDAEAVYNDESTWKIGDKVQGNVVKGDLVTLELDPFMKGSTQSRGFDLDGHILSPVTIIDAGVLKRYSADTRHAHYLGVEPTGRIGNFMVKGGSRTVSELKDDQMKTPYLETIAFSDFSVDSLTGDFCGEIRLARWFDGESVHPVTGGSISGNINEMQNEMYFSSELQQDNFFIGPKAIKLLNVGVSGVQ
ncbi:MAG: TldD/PmbA family protein [Clostridiales bacterium]|nr:TldD/PmbA family protein [Clostridiales bacterium]